MGWLRDHRAPAVGVFIAVSIIAFVVLGFPERQYVWFWLLAVLLLVCLHNPNRVAQVIIDWIPVLVILAGYDVVRGFADDLVARAMYKPQLRFDEILFGGTAPTVKLQQWLDVGKDPHPWDYAVFCFYLSHFFVTPVFALHLYRRDRERFHRYAMVILFVSLAAFATYLILPAAPPWLASEHHFLQPTIRVVQRVWASLGAGGAADAFAGKDTGVANPVAAVPSLHAAWPLLMLLCVWRRAPRGRYVALAYNFVMIFVLVYGAEHYVSDAVLGWIYAVSGFLIVNTVIDRRRARPDDAHPELATSPSSRS
jgi:hypothetical protein